MLDTETIIRFLEQPEPKKKRRSFNEVAEHRRLQRLVVKKKPFIQVDTTSRDGHTKTNTSFFLRERGKYYSYKQYLVLKDANGKNVIIPLADQQ